MTCKKKTYRQLCEDEPSIPLFSQAWWLDAAAGKENWDVALVRNGDRVDAAMPYVIQRKYGLTYLGQAPLSQTLGPWFRLSKGKGCTHLAQQKDWMNSLINQLPRFDHFSQSWHHSQTNWLPFYWAGFQQTTRYTYVLENLGNKEELWKNLQKNIRQDCRKASGQHKLSIDENGKIEDFLRLRKMVFERQDKIAPTPDEVVLRIDEACRKRKCRKIFIVRDAEQRAHAAVYLVWDKHTAYYLLGGSNPSLRNSGAVSFCVWEAINFAASVAQCFDFEGSMIEPIERFFRAFGATQRPYFRVYKTPSKLLRLKNFLRGYA